ncbi:MAG: arsenate reductase (glutaredoxin) [Rhodocyclaceae bacterium]|nr:arsenate reductase (glutaredoxin) [Rhodocyclaceae bacterium]
MSEKIRIYHNPRCSKSRGACALLAERGVEFEVIEYLKTPPSLEELRAIVALLSIRPAELVRRNENIFKEQYAGQALDDNGWLQAMVEHPILIERPIVVAEGRAVIGRPPERIATMLGGPGT